MHDLNIRDSFSGLSPGAFAPGTTFWYAQHGRHLYGESPEWGLASAYH